MFVEPEAAYAELDVDLRLESEVTAVDTRTGTVTLADGSELPYDKLVLASGTLPRSLGTPGEELAGVHRYRTLTDASAVRAAAESARSALVIGGGFIGMETTASLRRRGLAVTQIDVADRLYASLQAPPLSDSLERLYREKGVEVILGDKVAAFRGSAGTLTGAVTDAGREIEAELAIVGVGVQPATGLPRRLGHRSPAGHRASSTSASRPTSPASGPSATSRTSTIRCSATGG